MAKSVSRELRICLAIWRKAYNERDKDELVTINCPSQNAAMSLRQSMYRAARPFRDGSAFDEEVRKSTDLFVVYIDRETNQITLKPRSTLDTLEASLAELGINESDLRLPEERLLDKELTEFIEKGDKPRANQFYERE